MGSYESFKLKKKTLDLKLLRPPQKNVQLFLETSRDGACTTSGWRLGVLLNSFHRKFLLISSLGLEIKKNLPILPLLLSLVEISSALLGESLFFCLVNFWLKSELDELVVKCMFGHMN